MNKQAIMNYVSLLLLLLCSSIFCLRKSNNKFIPIRKNFIHYIDFDENTENNDLSYLDKYDYVYPNNDAFAIELHETQGTGFVYQVQQLPKGVTCVSCNKNMEGFTNFDIEKFRRGRNEYTGGSKVVIFGFTINEYSYNYSNVQEIRIGYNPEYRGVDVVGTSYLSIALVSQNVFNRYVKEK